MHAGWRRWLTQLVAGKVSTDATKKIADWMVQPSQGKYDGLTFWEQLDDGVQYTSNRKFLTLVPVVLFLLAAHGTDYRRQPLGLNLIVLLVLVVAKFPAMHKVRILGINKY